MNDMKPRYKACVGFPVKVYVGLACLAGIKFGFGCCCLTLCRFEVFVSLPTQRSSIENYATTISHGSLDNDETREVTAGPVLAATMAVTTVMMIAAVYAVL